MVFLPSTYILSEHINFSTIAGKKAPALLLSGQEGGCMSWGGVPHFRLSRILRDTLCKEATIKKKGELRKVSCTDVLYYYLLSAAVLQSEFPYVDQPAEQSLRRSGSTV